MVHGNFKKFQVIIISNRNVNNSSLSKATLSQFEEILTLKKQKQEEFESQFGDCIFNIIV